MPLHFIENRGQVDSRVRYYVKQGGGTVFFTDREVVLALPQVESHRQNSIKGKSSQTTEPEAALPRGEGHFRDHNRPRKLAVVRLRPVGGKKIVVAAQEPLPGRVNYFIGNDPQKWRTDIPTYRAVVYREVYEGIDIKYYGQGRQLEYDIIVQPGADPNQVRFAYQGVKKVKLTPEGDLALILPDGGTLIQKKPVIYQEVAGQRLPVAGKYRLSRQGAQVTWGFAVAAYDRSQPLVIDPVLVYSTYLGDSGADQGLGLAVDGSGAVYLTGCTDSTNFPLRGALQGSLAGDKDAFVTKLTPAGNALVYSTYLGGSNLDEAFGVAVAADGAAYIAGRTFSDNFPRQGAIQDHYGGAGDAFVTKLNPAGNNLVYATYLGGSNQDEARGIAVDASGAAYVIGSTSSTDFPLWEPFQGSNAGNWDVFVSKVNPTGSALAYSSYLGGVGNDYGRGIAVDASGAACLTGYTSSIDFPRQAALQNSHGGGIWDAFVTKLAPVGNNAFIFSTYLGGSAEDYAEAITVDGTGAVYVTGYTASQDFPRQTPLQNNLAGGLDAFVTKLTPAGNALAFSTYLGGSDHDYGNGIAVDASGAAYVTGYTYSHDFPLRETLQSNINGSPDAFITKLVPAGNALAFSSYLGGNGYDIAMGVVVDANNAYLTGYTSSTNFPIKRAWQSNFAGRWDIWVSKISVAGYLPPSLLLLE